MNRNKYLSAYLIRFNPVIRAFVIILYALSCTQPTPKNNIKEESQKSANRSASRIPASGFTDSLVINTRSAVFFKPDSLQWEKIRGVKKKEIFAMLEHDCYYQMKNVRTTLRQYWPQVKIIDALQVRYLVFVKTDNSRKVIDLDGNQDICGVILFDTKKDPVFSDMPNIETVLRYYFLNTASPR